MLDYYMSACSTVPSRWHACMLAGCLTVHVHMFSLPIKSQMKSALPCCAIIVASRDAVHNDAPIRAFRQKLKTYFHMAKRSSRVILTLDSCPCISARCLISEACCRPPSAVCKAMRGAWRTLLCRSGQLLPVHCDVCLRKSGGVRLQMQMILHVQDQPEVNQRSISHWRDTQKRPLQDTGNQLQVASINLVKYP